jgi:hypothetical protein
MKLNTLETLGKNQAIKNRKLLGWWLSSSSNVLA